MLQAQDLAWAGSTGGTGQDLGTGIAVDNVGNVYTTGLFRDLADFDPGIDTFAMESAGDDDVFVTKFDADGRFIWARSMGGSGRDRSHGIAVDRVGNVYTTGYFEESADFDPGAGVSQLTSDGSRDIFVSKLDSSGSFVWALRLGGSGNSQAWSIDTDVAGNVYVIGDFRGVVDFDPGPNAVELTNISVTSDSFVVKLTGEGSLSWVRQLGAIPGKPIGSSNFQTRGLYVDSASNVYVTGGFIGLADFDGGPGVSNLNSPDDWDVYVLKLDGAGGFVWVRQMGGPNSDVGQSVATDLVGNVFVTGWLYESADFDPGPGVVELTSEGEDDIFLVKLDGSGGLIWVNRIGGASRDVGESVAADTNGGVYLTGWFGDTVDFDPSGGVTTLTAKGYDVFVARFDGAGNLVRADGFGAGGFDVGEQGTVDAAGNFYVTGYYLGTADFDPGPGIVTLASAGGLDAFYLKFGNAGINLSPLINPGGIISANLAPKVSSISPLSIISVFGENFSTQAILSPNLDGEKRIDTILADTCLLMNGSPLPLFAVTPRQINAQVADTAGLGPASFSVVSNCGTTEAVSIAPLRIEPAYLTEPYSRAVTSGLETALVEKASPSFFIFDPVANDGYIAARFNESDGQPPVPVAPVDRFPDDSFGPSRPAEPGDIIVLYGTGWGKTTAPLTAGELATDAAWLAEEAGWTVSFGGVLMAPEDILYVGATPGTAGLYQLALRVPEAVTPGDNRVVLKVYGRSTPTGPVVPISGGEGL